MTNSIDDSGNSHGDVINWADIHQRIEETLASINRGFALSADKKRSILKERAKLLSREIQESKDKVNSIRVVQFVLGSEKYGIEMQFIREIIPLSEFTPLPGTPSYILGILNVRGKIISIIDLKRMFDFPGETLKNRAMVIILSYENMEFGIQADAVLAERFVPFENVRKSLPTITGVREEYLKGVCDDNLIILDGAKIIADERIIINEEVTA